MLSNDHRTAMKKIVIGALCAASLVVGYGAARLVGSISEPAEAAVEKKAKSNRATNLREAVANGDMRTLLIKKDEEDMMAVDEDGGTLLHLAAENGQADIAYVLMHYGLDPSASREDGKTAADLAQNADTWMACRYGIALKALSQNVRNAVKQRNEEEALKMLKEGADPNIKPDDKEERFMLFDAVESGSVKMVEALLQAGADIHAVHGDRSIVFASVWGDQPTMVPLLVNAGADPLFRANNWSTPLHAAAWFGKVEVFKELMPYYKDFNYSFCGRWGATYPAIIAIEMAKPAVVELLLKSGFNPNDSRFNSETPLMRAAKRRRDSIIEMLLEYGEDPDKKDPSGKRAVDYAQNKGAEMLRNAKKK